MQNVEKFVINFLKGNYEAGDVDTQIDAGWYDWFCRDSSLAGKTKTLGNKVVQLLSSDKIDTENMYVFFKNNCPIYGSLYDDFRFCDIETGDVIYTVTPKSGHDNNKGIASVWGRENNFKGPLIEGSWKDVKNFFGV